MASALTICRIYKELPLDYLAKLNTSAFGLIDNVKADPVVGWAGWRHAEAPIDEENTTCGGFIRFQLVGAQRKIQAALFKDECRRQELAFMASTGIGGVPSKEKRRIKADVKERLTMKMPPIIKTVEVIIDIKNKTVYVGTVSQKDVDNVTFLLHKCLEVEIVPLSPDMIVFETLGIHEVEIPQLCFAGSKDDTAHTGRDFLTWFWFFSEQYGGKTKIHDTGDFESMIQGPLLLANPTSEAKGSAESSVKKGGCPTASAEARAALLAGKKLKKSKLLIVRGQEVWSGTFDADKFAFSGLTFPEGEEMEQHARFAGRVLNMEILTRALVGYFMRFLGEFSIAPGEMSATTINTKIRAWAEERESY